MKTDKIISYAAILFAVIGLALIVNLQSSSNKAIGYVVADQQSSQGILAGINGFLVKAQLPEATRERYLPVYILANLIFISVIIVFFDRMLKRQNAADI